MEKIRTLVCAAPGELALEHRAAQVPAADEALVRTLRVGICGTDYHIYEGKHPFLQYPRVMGHELAVQVVSAPEGSGFESGEVCSVNPYVACGKCRTCRAGKPNCCEKIQVLGVHRDGGMTEKFALPVRNLLKTDGLSADDCAVIEFLAIGAHAVRRGAPHEEDQVLVVGAGPIGLGAALFARLTGASVALYDVDRDRAERVAALAGVQAAEAEAEAYDVVFDASGNRAAMEQGFERAAPGGKFVMVGVIKDHITFFDPDFHRKELTLLASRNATQEDFDHVMAAIRAGEIDTDRIITHRTGLESSAADLARWTTEKDGLIKAVIEIG